MHLTNTNNLIYISQINYDRGIFLNFIDLLNFIIHILSAKYYFYYFLAYWNEGIISNLLNWVVVIIPLLDLAYYDVLVLLNYRINPILNVSIYVS